jgi:hypothetical protein
MREPTPQIEKNGACAPLKVRFAPDLCRCPEIAAVSRQFSRTGARLRQPGTLARSGAGPRDAGASGRLGPRDAGLGTAGSARRAQRGHGSGRQGLGARAIPPHSLPARPAPCEPSMQHVRALLAAALRCCVGLLYRCQAAPPRVSSPQPRLPSSRAPSSLAGANRAPLRLHRPRAASHHSRMTAASVFDPPGRHEARGQAVDRPAGFSQLLGASHFLLVQFGQGSTSRPIGVTSRARGARWWPAHPLRACE